MDYVGFLVEKNKNRNERELLALYYETEKLNNSTGEMMLAGSIKDAISWILRLKSPSFIQEYTRLRSLKQ